MAGKAATLDPAALAEGIGGKLVPGKGYARLVGGDGKTLAYIKKNSIAVPASLVAKAPKKVGTFKVEANGRWAGAKVSSTDKARAIVEYVAGQREAVA